MYDWISIDFMENAYQLRIWIAIPICLNTNFIFRLLFSFCATKYQHLRENHVKICLLTVLLPRFRTRQLKYADFPTRAVTLFGILVSKYGSFHFGFKNELNGGCVVLPSVNVLYPSRGRCTVLARPILEMGGNRNGKEYIVIYLLILFIDRQSI